MSARRKSVSNPASGRSPPSAPKAGSTGNLDGSPAILPKLPGLSKSPEAHQRKSPSFGSPTYETLISGDSEWTSVDLPQPSPKKLFARPPLSPHHSSESSPSLSFDSTEARRSTRLYRKQTILNTPVSMFRTMLAKLPTAFENSHQQPIFHSSPISTIEHAKKPKHNYPADTSALLAPELIPSDSDDESYCPTNTDTSSDSESDLEFPVTVPEELSVGPVHPSYLVDWLSIQMYRIDHRQAQLKQSQRTLTNLVFLSTVLIIMYCALFKRIPWQLHPTTLMADLRVMQTWLTFVVMQLAANVQSIFGSLHSGAS